MILLLVLKGEQGLTQTYYEDSLKLNVKPPLLHTVNSELQYDITSGPCEQGLTGTYYEDSLKLNVKPPYQRPQNHMHGLYRRESGG